MFFKDIQPHDEWVLSVLSVTPFEAISNKKRVDHPAIDCINDALSSLAVCLTESASRQVTFERGNYLVSLEIKCSSFVIA